MSDRSDYIRCVSGPLEASLRAQIADLKRQLAAADEPNLDAGVVGDLVEALRPFAVYYEINDLDDRLADDAIEVPVGDLRRAAAALSKHATQQGIVTPIEGEGADDA